MNAVTSFPPLFGIRRPLQCPPPERIDFAAGDGTALCLHRIQGGSRGPVIVTPGTAMTALSYCIDTVPLNFAEFLSQQGYDVWLFDWRTSPLLASHEMPYTLDDVARYDWPAAVAEVRRRTEQDQVCVVSHCLSSPCFLFSLLRGYTNPAHIKSFVGSQVAFHFTMTTLGRIKMQARVDWLLSRNGMIHQKPSRVTGQFADIAISALNLVLPKGFSCSNRSCYRHAATFGEVIEHSMVNKPTHDLMGDLIPECLTGFLKDVAVRARRKCALEVTDYEHLDRLKLPIHLISGSKNRMFVPRATELSYMSLCEANGSQYYQRTVFQGFGHLDCFIGETAKDSIWPVIVKSLN